MASLLGQLAICEDKMDLVVMLLQTGVEGMHDKLGLASLSRLC